ncbi:uncharacterized protein LOC121859339 [Homarus americanus]|uniref:uncharacterized protein LOC121859339 n=1 Tax=Homarus americanus TaxID=6706 RepID=UPI001C4538AB|nr:uncharacterized protein LOC121859339 [Homarus americanus]
MAGEGRRASLTSSLVTDVTGFPSMTEEEISGLNVEQLENAAEELHALCSLMQAELDLYSRFLSSQVVQEDAAPSTQTHFTPGGKRCCACFSAYYFYEYYPSSCFVLLLLLF